MVRWKAYMSVWDKYVDPILLVAICFHSHPINSVSYIKGSTALMIPFGDFLVHLQLIIYDYHLITRHYLSLIIIVYPINLNVIFNQLHASAKCKQVKTSSFTPMSNESNQSKQVPKDFEPLILQLFSSQKQKNKKKLLELFNN